MFRKHPMSGEFTNSCKDKPVCSPLVPMCLPQRLNPINICFVEYDGMSFMDNSKIAPTIEQIMINF